MKYITVLYDGMADTPVAQLGGKTPMQAARKPRFDAMGRDGEVGLAKTVAPGLKPGSDVANLSVLGYDPAKYYTGRSPLEAVSMGVPMQPDDLTLRCNLVTLSDGAPFDQKSMLDYSGGEISTEEAAQLMQAVQTHLGGEEFTYYAGVQYRHCLLWHGAKALKEAIAPLTPPHDISDRPITGYLPQTLAASPLLRMMEASFALLSAHPVNIKRREQGKPPANCIWLWGEGTRPALPPFEEITGLKGSIISAVDLLKGIGALAGMRTPDVTGATGWLDTNYEGKARCAVEELKAGQDFVYLHFEASDESGHRGDAAAKVRAIELIDERVWPILQEYLDTLDDYAVLLCPDHPTPLALKTHTSEPVPYLLYRRAWRGSGRGVECVSEESAAATGNYVGFGPDLMKKFIGK
ncbi:MAG: cofactor-independent phosphoglycerate mutase [Oscillospiraceae bacterium]|jgi:2,3-bisphosphoglycerate-independent phosphoglycerate mutase|nr:cofactor-independent phosphoglycerate mutase [Oscillospiraceae bacterium]